MLFNYVIPKFHIRIEHSWCWGSVPITQPCTLCTLFNLINHSHTNGSMRVPQKVNGTGIKTRDTAFVEFFSLLLLLMFVQFKNWNISNPLSVSYSNEEQCMNSSSLVRANAIWSAISGRTNIQLLQQFKCSTISISLSAHIENDQIKFKG